MLDDGRTDPLRVAVCISGIERTLLSWPVVTGYRKHLFAPHTAAGHQVDTFLVLVGTSARSSEATRRLFDNYRPVWLSQFRPRRLEDVPAFGRCNPAHQNYTDKARSLTQWLAIQHCYHRVQQHETRLKFQYTWIYRTRTDVVLLADTPIAAMPTRAANMSGRVYVPITSMSDSRVCEFLPLTTSN